VWRPFFRRHVRPRAVVALRASRSFLSSYKTIVYIDRAQPTCAWYTECYLSSRPSFLPEAAVVYIGHRADEGIDAPDTIYPYNWTMSWELGKHRNTMRLYNMEVFDRIKEVFVMLLVMDACAAATCPCNLHTGCKWPAAIRTDEAYCYNRSRVEKVDGTCEILSNPRTILPLQFSKGIRWVCLY
jgi:hypothetical protein